MWRGRARALPSSRSMAAGITPCLLPPSNSTARHCNARAAHAHTLLPAVKPLPPNADPFRTAADTSGVCRKLPDRSRIVSGFVESFRICPPRVWMATGSIGAAVPCQLEAPPSTDPFRTAAGRDQVAARQAAKLPKVRPAPSASPVGQLRRPAPSASSDLPHAAAVHMAVLMRTRACMRACVLECVDECVLACVCA
jgi:hypothetical protein